MQTISLEITWVFLNLVNLTQFCKKDINSSAIVAILKMKLPEQRSVKDYI